METEVVKVSSWSPEKAVIERAAELLRSGQLVAFPTDTVYGLGANALDSAAAAKIFEAKGRPPANPLIVHVPDAEAAKQVVGQWPESAQRLADRFWPGPLTLVLPKSERIPANVTAGGSTVAVRAPRHNVAQALLKAAGVPIAAPSANRSTTLSPTLAKHVLKSLGQRIPLILDSGSTKAGIESTVLDLTCTVPRILRPGPVTGSELTQTIGPVEYCVGESSEGVLASPGMLARHYAPDTPLVLEERQSAFDALQRLRASGHRIGFLTFGADEADVINHRVLAPGVTGVNLPSDPGMSAAMLYDNLHFLDELGLDVILVALPPATEELRAIRDRLQRAARKSE